MLFLNVIVGGFFAQGFVSAVLVAPQPAFLGFEGDKKPDECTWAQRA